jgi:hypothetical protein
MEVPHAGDATGEEVMEVMYPRCAGLDVHKETVVACVRIVEGGDVSRSVRTFATTTASLIELGEWLEVNGCTHVAMEATGVYWKPVGPPWRPPLLPRPCRRLRQRLRSDAGSKV